VAADLIPSDLETVLGKLYENGAGLRYVFEGYFLDSDPPRKRSDHANLCRESELRMHLEKHPRGE